MPTARLSALDASFLDVETPNAHMHVGWAATFTPPAQSDSRCDFEALRNHIVARLGRAPRYRQKLAPVPLDVSEPLWVDDPNFDPDLHIRRAESGDLGRVVDAVMSVPLERDRPLWEMWLLPRMDDGRIGMVGKAHHCMVDGLAAVELALMLLDPAPEGIERPEDGDSWEPAPTPGALVRLADGTADRARQRIGALLSWGRTMASPQRLMDMPADALRMTSTLANTLLPVAPPSILNRASSPHRHLAASRRPLNDLRQVKRRFGATINDVVLAAAAGTMRRYVLEHGGEPAPLKTMVPVSVRRPDDDGAFGNRISFMFVELPCQEPDAVRRIEMVHAATRQRKEMGEPEQSDAVLQAAGLLPRVFQRVMSRAVASPKLFNLVVSNIPGPRAPMYMRGCELQEAYPIVPLADRHALSIGVTTVRDEACFGLYADRELMPDADRAAELLDEELDEMLSLVEEPARLALV